jgi:septum formation protein
MRFVLASASPARLATLRTAGVEPEVIASDLDESSITASSTSALVVALARAKALAVSRGLSDGALVLGCDSMLDLDGEAFGKPADPDDAKDRWRRMRGRAGTLHTGHALVRGTAVVCRDVRTIVHFGSPTDAEIDAYVATGEPMEVAGGFTIDGLGGWLVDGIDGDHHNVVGLSLPAVRAMLADVGVALTDLGWPRATA